MPNFYDYFALGFLVMILMASVFRAISVLGIEVIAGFAVCLLLMPVLGYVTLHSTQAIRNFFKRKDD